MSYLQSGIVPGWPVSVRPPIRTIRRQRLALYPLVVIALIISLINLGPARALDGLEGSAAETEARASGYLSHAALAPGGSGTLLILVHTPENFHIQKNIFLEVLLPEDAPITLGTLNAPATAEWDHEPVLKGTIRVTVPFTVKSDAAPGGTSFSATFGYQGCTEGPVYACYPPSEIPLPLSLEILPAGGAARTANEAVFEAHVAATPPPSAPGADGVAEEEGSLAGRLRNALARGSLVAFVLVFLGGVVSSLTPCVYPMIPITISFVGGRASSRLQGFVLALFFVLGLAIMYAILGLVAASTGAVFGSIMQSTTALIVVAAIFAAMGASMLGAFDLVLPTSLTTSMTTASSGAAAKGGGASSIVGAILMGMTTGLVASPCVGPVLVVLLTFVANTGNLLYGFWLLFTFACGLGLLFLVLGTFAGAMNALPGAGSWMDTVKHAFGVILIAMAIYYLRSLMGPATIRFVVGVYLVLVGVFTGAFTPLSADPTRSALLRKALGILLFLSGAVVFLLWLFTLTGAPLLSGAGPTKGPVAPGTSLTAHAEPAWIVNDEAVLAEASALGKPAVQDFYADWCTACVELDHKTWSDPRILEESRRWVALKMDFTKRDEWSKAARARYGVVGMPTVVFYDSQGTEVQRFFGFKGPDEVLAIMESVE